MGDTADGSAGSDGPTPDAGGDDAGGRDDPTAALRERVEEKYDFDEFTPADMAEMSAEEWEAAFDPESWITGPALLDRVEADLKDRVKRREVFAVVERDGDERLVAYTDAGYATVRPDGTVSGEGSIIEDVKPVVALCSMDDYDPPAMPEGDLLPDPAEIGGGSGDLGDRLVQALAAVQLLAGLSLLVAGLALGVGASGSVLVTTVAGSGFIAVGLFLFLIVANARLSDRFRAEEYRRRLLAAGVGREGRPEFVPLDGDDEGGDRDDGEQTE